MHDVSTLIEDASARRAFEKFGQDEKIAVDGKRNGKKNERSGGRRRAGLSDFIAY